MGILKMSVPIILVFFVGCGVPVSSTTPPPTAAPSPIPDLPPTQTFEPEATPIAAFTPPTTLALVPTVMLTTSPTPGLAPVTAPITPVSDNSVTLSLEAADSQPVTAGSEVLLEVWLDPQGHSISGVQFDIAYDPGQLQVLGFAPGSVPSTDPVVIEKIIARPGVALYAVARRGAASPPTPDGTVAVLKLRVGENVSPGTPVQLSLQRVKIADENFQQLVGVVVAPPLQLVINSP